MITIGSPASIPTDNWVCALGQVCYIQTVTQVPYKLGIKYVYLHMQILHWDYFNEWHYLKQTQVHKLKMTLGLNWSLENSRKPRLCFSFYGLRSMILAIKRQLFCHTIYPLQIAKRSVHFVRFGLSLGLSHVGSFISKHCC